MGEILELFLGDVSAALPQIVSINAAAGSLDRASNLMQGGHVRNGVGNQQDRSQKQREESPRAKQQILPLEFPEFSAHTRLAQITGHRNLSARDQHPDVSIEGHRCRGAHFVANLTAREFADRRRGLRHGMYPLWDAGFARRHRTQ